MYRGIRVISTIYCQLVNDNSNLIRVNITFRMSMSALLDKRLEVL